MVEKFLSEKMPFLKETDENLKKQFTEYFYNAPLWLFDSMEVILIEEGEMFVREGEQAKNIFFLVTGIVEAIDLRIYGAAFNYTQFSDVYAFGAMEVVLEVENYMTTLRSLTKCSFIKISRKMYERWLFSDSKALRREAKILTKNLLDEARNERLFLFTQGSDRLALLLIRRYEFYNVNGEMKLDYNRQCMADATGTCIKTVSRSIKYFSEKGLITKEGNKIIINSDQYDRLKKTIHQVDI